MTDVSGRREGLDPRSLARHYAPIAVALLALALFVAVVPSRPEPEADLVAGRVGAGGAPVPGSPGAAGATSEGDAAANGEGSGGRSGGGNGGATGNVGGGGSGPTSPDGAPFTIGPPPGNCERKRVLGGTCPPTFSGANGGATYSGVDGDSIQLVFYEPQRDEQTDAVLAQADFHTREDLFATFEAWEEYVNRPGAYQLYGREVDIVVQSGPGDPVPEEQVADAVMVTAELGAFATMSEAGYVEFHDEVSRRRVPNVDLFTVQSRAYHDQWAPYAWSISPDLDLSTGHVAEYWCKRLQGKPAVHAGSAVIQTQTRKLGIVHPPWDPSGQLLERAVERCGGKVARTVEYSLDYATAVQQSINIVAQMQEAGVTTITCLCDPIFPVFLTQTATGQGWFPEWLHNGYAATDSGYTGRLYDQAQWTNSFGVSVLEPTQPLQTHRGWKAFFAVRDDTPGNRRILYRTSYLYALLEMLLEGIEGAGPDLNPVTFRDGMFGADFAWVPRGPRRYHLSLGPSGPSPFTLIDSVTEIWYSATQPGPDGGPGWVYFVDGGRRYLEGKWPRSAPKVFVDDGSKQVEFDPDHP